MYLGWQQLNPSRTQSDQWPEINIRNQGESADLSSNTQPSELHKYFNTMHDDRLYFDYSYKYLRHLEGIFQHKIIYQ